MLESVPREESTRQVSDARCLVSHIASTASCRNYYESLSDLLCEFAMLSFCSFLCDYRGLGFYLLCRAAGDISQVTGIETVPSFVQHCFGLLWSDRASQHCISLGIVPQRMVEAEVARQDRLNKWRRVRWWRQCLLVSVSICSFPR